MTVTLITGANKGIGFETAAQLADLGHSLWIGARDAERGRVAAEKIGARSVQLDVTDQASVEAALAAVEAEEGRLDVLVNNAGVMGDLGTSAENALAVLETNVVGIIRVTEAALPLLRRSANPVVANVSSSMGSFWAVTNPERPEYGLRSMAYAASKSAASMVTVQYAKANPGIKFNALEPGFTATDLTAFLGGGRPVEQSARVVARLATLGPDGPTGTLQDENGALPW